MESSLRPFATAGVALAGAAVIAVTPVAPPPLAGLARAVQLTAGDTIGLVIGGSGTPIPGSNYVGAANDLYIQPNFPDTTYPGVLANGLFTPEGLYPLDGVKVLTFNYPDDSNGFPAQSTSVGQGLTILDDNVHANLADGNNVTVFGYSQSATIASLEMQKLVQDGYSDAPVQFVLIGDPSAPNGGILERFSGFETSTGDTHALPLNLSSLGFSFSSSTPDGPFTTDIYSMEYDGFTDFPRYPLNFLADLNAFLGIRTLHGTYLNQGFTPPHDGGPTPDQIANAILLPGSMDSTTDPCDDCTTNYYMIEQAPPLVQMLPQPLQDLLGPDLTYLINLGYGDGDQGFSDAPANVATPFGLFPDVDPMTVLSHLFGGAQQGMAALAADLANPAAWALPDAASGSTDAVTDAAAATPTDIVNAFSSALSTAYATLLPTADIINALLTSVPAYDASLFFGALGDGDVLGAFGLPLAANTAIGVLAAGFELQIIGNAVSDIEGAFSGL